MNLQSIFVTNFIQYYYFTPRKTFWDNFPDPKPNQEKKPDVKNGKRLLALENGTLNIRTITESSKLEEAVKTLCEYKLEVLGLSEIRLK